MTSSGLISFISSGVTGVFSLMSIPSLIACSPIKRAASFISPFLGASPARANCPPNEDDASQSTGIWPLFFNCKADSNPATPPPAINTFFGVSVTLSLYSSSRPRAGFLRQVINGISVDTKPS